MYLFSPCVYGCGLEQQKLYPAATATSEHLAIGLAVQHRGKITEYLGLANLHLA